MNTSRGHERDKHERLECELARDLEELHSHDYGISGGSALQAGLTLPSVAELGDTEETSSYEWTSRLRDIRIYSPYIAL